MDNIFDDQGNKTSNAFALFADYIDDPYASTDGESTSSEENASDEEFISINQKAISSLFDYEEEGKEESDCRFFLPLLANGYLSQRIFKVISDRFCNGISAKKWI